MTNKILAFSLTILITICSLGLICDIKNFTDWILGVLLVQMLGALMYCLYASILSILNKNNNK
jgi:uncharacterized membrane protein